MQVKFFHGPPRPAPGTKYFVPRLLTRDLFAVANLLVHSLSGYVQAQYQ